MDGVRMSRGMQRTVLLVIYGILIPMLCAGDVLSAGWNKNTAKWRDSSGAWVNFVKNCQRMRLRDITQFDQFYTFGINKWDVEGIINVNWNNNNFEVAVFDLSASNCTQDGLALTFRANNDPPNGYIRNNVCLMEWDGGYYAPYGRDTGRTRASRKRRTAAHEVAHALGFYHYPDDGFPCRSLMSEILSDRNPEGCTVPTEDDLDIYHRWNY